MKPFILIVDDNEIDSLKISRTLELAGMVPVAVMSGAAALDAGRKYRPQAFLVDIQMPRMNGFQFMQELKTRADVPDAPIILMSASRRATDDVRAAIEAGAKDFIVKPIDAASLIAKLQRAMQGKPGVSERLLTPGHHEDNAKISVPVRVVSLNESTLTVAAPLPLPNGFSPQIDSALMREMGLNANHLQVAGSMATDDGFSISVNLVGLSLDQLKRLRAFCMSLGAKAPLLESRSGPTENTALAANSNPSPFPDTSVTSAPAEQPTAKKKLA